MPEPELTTLTAPDGTAFRDLDHDGVMAPFEDPRRTPGERADDLVARLSLAEKIGLFFHDIIEVGPGGALMEGDGRVARSSTRARVVDRLINHVNVHALPTARESARWSNALQALAATTPHSIPVTVSTDPRHSSTENSGAAFAAGAMSAWPEPLGLAALHDVERVREFADAARQEYLAVGIRSALHPQIDLGTEPRWGRQFHTFGNDSAFVADVAAAYVEGFQLGPDLGPTSVATMAKHFPGGGPQLDGEDAHFPYGREQVYPGGRFADHLVPFRRAIAAGTSALMPYYGMPVGLELDGVPVEEVGFGYNRQILTGLLREQLGFDGVICTDWGLVTGTVVAGRPLPARAWGVEHLSELDRLVKIIDAGADQLGGESRTDLLLEAVEQGLVGEQRLDASVRRLLLVKLRLGLFDDPFVDEDVAEEVVGRADLRAAGRRAQAESMVLLEHRPVAGAPVLPLRPGLRLYVEGWPETAAARLGEVVGDPAEADVAVVRLEAPFEPRDDLFLETFFHQGSLAYRPGLVARLRQIARTTPLIIGANLERPALLAAFADVATVLLTDVGASAEAFADVLSGAVAPLGRLPFEVPRSADAVRRSQSDVANDTEDPLYPAGAGLSV
ncbi:glycoside hydrolase family 3 protein [Microlunatus antarcticus]|uniref:beta-glucosidase n=1 Tax=Microlunatus antarcticus TaxID=53388 RepID=A0A7W5JS46_9ACTN|nr:glycoside hydrolase family 3 N-terminal domain-containing protein [Microlunatus antarcticus]MBB3325320.1 beta-glucosidase [Microlunatus antarcticus]